MQAGRRRPRGLELAGGTGILTARDHGPSGTEGLDISCVPCSLCCHVPIRCAAVFKYDSEGSGVLNGGSGWRAGKSAGGICGLLAQAVRDNPQPVKITAQQRLAVTGGIERSLVFGGHGLLGNARAGVSRALGRAGGQLLGGGFQPGLGQLGAQARALELPVQRGGHGCGCHMGVKRGDHDSPLSQRCRSAAHWWTRPGSCLPPA